MPNTDRPKVGPADPETRRKLLREKLDQPTRAEGVAPAAADQAPKPKKKKGNGTTLAGLLDRTQSRDRTVEGKNETIMDAVNRGVEMGTQADEAAAAPKKRKRVVSE